MGCASSKKIGATSPTTTRKTAALEIYHPPPSSFAVFDINSIEEPWLKLESTLLSETNFKKPSHVPAPLLEKLDSDESESAPPRSWDEISKALDDFKSQPPPPPPSESTNSSVHTVEELETKSQPPPPLESTNSSVHTVEKLETKPKPKLKPVQPQPDSNPVKFGTGSETGYRSVKENPFIKRDMIEREKEGKEGFLDKLAMLRRDPLGGFPEKCPPGGAAAVVLYTTSLGGVRKTFEECNRARTVLEVHRVVFDERDVSLHGEFLTELRELVGESASVPRLFIHGRYIGGVDEVVELNETGRLGRILSWARVERGVGWQGCEGCGGARFMPCIECGGSCKVVVGDDKERCPKCNENGLVPCPLCH